MPAGADPAIVGAGEAGDGAAVEPAGAAEGVGEGEDGEGAAAEGGAAGQGEQGQAERDAGRQAALIGNILMPRYINIIYGVLQSPQKHLGIRVAGGGCLRGRLVSKP